MAKKYEQGKVFNNATRFTQAPMGEIEFSRMTSTPVHLTTFNAGDIIPIYCTEILPHDTYDIDLNFVIRQTTALVPSMGNMFVDIYAYFVPNRIVNESWKNVQGENTSGAWIAPEVVLAPLVATVDSQTKQVPVGSVADYYGFPTQQPLRNDLLAQCNDLKFRGYLECFNTKFRSENYQPPIPYSKLNVYNGFFEEKGSVIGFKGPAGQNNVGPDGSTPIDKEAVSDGSYPDGAIVKAVYGDGGAPTPHSYENVFQGRLTTFSALDKPLKANKLHDLFTSVLPSPQKGPAVELSIGDFAPLVARSINELSPLGNPLWVNTNYTFGGAAVDKFNLQLLANKGSTEAEIVSSIITAGESTNNHATINATNLGADLSKATAVSINDLRDSIALQQTYEVLSRNGSRYVEQLNSFFGLDIDNPFDDIPVDLGHIRRELDLYQTAQTSASQDGSPQGNLSAFGYTVNGGKICNKTFLEHGYLHIFAVVRHKNIYTSYFAPDNFRRSRMDYYNYTMANLGEQPVRTAFINPFDSELDDVFGYNEAWFDYRMEPDRVSGAMRTGLGEQGIDQWTYADDFDSTLRIADGDWLKSNSEEVLNRSIAVDSSLAPQFKGQFMFRITKQRAMPTYSVAGLDIL